MNVNVFHCHFCHTSFKVTLKKLIEAQMQPDACNLAIKLSLDPFVRLRAWHVVIESKRLHIKTKHEKCLSMNEFRVIYFMQYNDIHWVS